MSKVKIKIVFLGHIPHALDIDKIVKWKSDLFEIMKPINTVAIVGNSDGAYWEFLDENIEEQLPARDGADILLAVTNVPLQSNYFARRFSDNRVCMTYNTMTEILKFDNIPLENLLLRVLYSIAFVYRRYGNRMPLMTEHTNFTHDETRGCIFDMNGVKTDVVYSLNGPQLCHSCVEILTTTPKHKIEKEIIDKVQGELKKIKKGLYYQLTDFIKRRPILAIIISSLVAIFLGIIGSTIATIIWEKLIK
jgi:hypothetical protein